MIYKTYLDRLICPEDMIVTNKNIVSVLRSNSKYLDIALTNFTINNPEYYIHYLDGDNWKEREIWINGNNADTETAMQFFEMAEYKDCIVMYADEFLIIDIRDRAEDITNILKNKDFAMTGVIAKGNKPINSWNDIKTHIHEKLYNSKKIEKGKLYYSLIE